MVDTVIVGGGPAGASCALWLKMLGFKPCIIERRASLGGLQNDSPYPNQWIAPIFGKSGAEVAAEMHAHILSHGIECRLGEAVVEVSSRGNGFAVTTDIGAQIDGKTVVLASGVRPSTGGLKAALNLLVGPGVQVASQDFAGKQVAILGGGDNAFENYLFIKNRGAANVHIYARSIRARKEFLETVPVEDVHVGQYSVDERQTTVSGRQYDQIVVLYGWEPHLPYAKSLGLARDPRGFVMTDPDCQTSVPGAFAIGEVAQRMHPCCVTSMADGVVAAKAIQRTLERDAVTKFVATAKRAGQLFKQMARS